MREYVESRQHSVFKRSLFLLNALQDHIQTLLCSPSAVLELLFPPRCRETRQEDSSEARFILATAVAWGCISRNENLSATCHYSNCLRLRIYCLCNLGNCIIDVALQRG